MWTEEELVGFGCASQHDGGRPSQEVDAVCEARNATNRCGYCRVCAASVDQRQPRRERPSESFELLGLDVMLDED